MSKLELIKLIVAEGRRMGLQKDEIRQAVLYALFLYRERLCTA